MRLALIAGEGALPVAIAEKLYKSGEKILIIALRDDLERLKPFAGKLIYLRSPSLSKGVREMRRFNIKQIIMAGRIPKRVIYKLALLVIFDRMTRRVLAESLKDDHSLLGGIVAAFEREGFEVIPYWQILPEFIASAGCLASRGLNKSELADVECGVRILKVTLPLSFGQAVVVARGAVVAVEAMEGTDAMIERAGKLANCGCVVKMMRSDQDRRYDLPTVGPRTIEKMRAAGLTCLAVEAGCTVILEPDETLKKAAACGIAVWGIKGS